MDMLAKKRVKGRCQMGRVDLSRRESRNVTCWMSTSSLGSFIQLMPQSGRYIRVQSGTLE